MRPLDCLLLSADGVHSRLSQWHLYATELEPMVTPWKMDDWKVIYVYTNGGSLVMLCSLEPYELWARTEYSRRAWALSRLVRGATLESVVNRAQKQATWLTRGTCMFIRELLRVLQRLSLVQLSSACGLGTSTELRFSPGLAISLHSPSRPSE